MISPSSKRDDPSNPSNYHPVSLTIISNAFETVIHDQLHSFLEREGPLSDYQNTFRPRSSIDNLLSRLKILDGFTR